MFRERPLTWLFVIATICVDLVMVATEKGSDNSVFRIGLVLGQLAALSIWTVRGQSHRLTRVSCLVVATGSLAYLIDLSMDPTKVKVAFLSGYVCLIALAALVGNLLRWPAEKGEGSKKRWRIPLIEFFGWTTVVAIISFGARHMNFAFLFKVDTLLIVVAMLAVPVSTALLVRRDLRDLRIIRAIVIVLVAILAAIYLSAVRASGAYGIFFQTAYLTLWLAVIGMDEVKTITKSVHETLLEEPSQAPTKPKLFNPQD